MDLEMKGDRESLMDVGCRLAVADVRENVSCCLCRGILRRAVTINLCLHSFCRKCLLKHLRRSKVCPKCLVLIHPLTPLINIRCDYVLQRIVYKLFPDLFRREQEKQKARCLANQIAGTEASNAITKREFDESLAVFTGKETVSLCLQLQQSSSLSEEMETQEDSSVRYLQCQAAVTIGILKRFIENKLSLGSHLEVKIFYKDNLIADAYTIADVACSYGWAQVEPMLLCYTIIQLSSGLRELYTRVTEPCRNSRDGDRSSGKFSGSMTSGTSSSRSNPGTSVPPSFCSSGQVLLSPANTSLSLEKKIPRKRGRPPKLRNLSSMSSSSSSSPPKKRIQCQMTGPEDHPSLLPSTGILAVPETGVPVDSGGSGASQVPTGVEISKQVDAAMFEEDVGSSFRLSDIVEHQVSTASSDANLSLRDSRLEGGSGCDSVEQNGIPDSATPGSVPLSSPVVDPPSEERSEITSGGTLGQKPWVSGSETLIAPTSDQRKSGSEVSEVVVQSTQTAKNPEDCPATAKNRSFLEFAPTVHKEQNQERKSLNRDGSKEELSPTGGGKSDGNTAARSNGVSLAVDSFCPQCGRREENIEGRTSVSSRRCENCLCISTSITVFINHAQKNSNGADEYQGPFNGGSLARQVPAQVDSGPKKLSGGGTDSDDIVPKLECPDFSDGGGGGGGGGRAQGFSRSPEKACVQQQHCRLGQPPADPRDPPRAQTKTNCRPVAAERSTPGQSNGFPSRDRVTDESSSPDAAGERCPIGATALNGNRPARRQKSLETIIQQLQPRQMSPVAMGNVVGPGSPRVSMATPLPTAPVRGWEAASLSSGAGLCGSGQRKEESVVGGCRRAVRSAGEGSNPRPSPQTDNRANSLLRRALTCSMPSFPDPKSRRCFPSSPSKPPNAAAAAAAAPSVDRLPQAPFNLLAPSIKRLKTLYEGLDASRSHRNNSISNISAPNEENRQRIFHQRTPPVMAPMTLRDAPGVNSPGVNSAAPAAAAAAPEAVIGRASYDVITATMTKRFPAVVANGFDAPLELTTKESRDRKWRESSRKSGDADVLRTSFPLFGNR